jgi:hypothetical protein
LEGRPTDKTLRIRKCSPPEVYYPKAKGAPICPSTAYQGAETLCIHMIWMYDAFYGGLEGLPTDKTTRIPNKNAFLLVKCPSPEVY